MRSAGYTLIELLVVISIIAILAVLGFVNFKNFAADQVTVKAQGQVQTLLRLAQSNATTSTLCNGQGGVPWSLIFNTTSSAANSAALTTQELAAILNGVDTSSNGVELNASQPEALNPIWLRTYLMNMIAGQQSLPSIFQRPSRLSAAQTALQRLNQVRSGTATLSPGGSTTMTTTINLACGPANSVQKTYTLENAQVAITGDSNCSIGFPATLSYSSRIGTQSLSSSGASNACLRSSAITFTVSNIRNPNSSPRLFKVSKGGAIDVQ